MGHTISSKGINASPKSKALLDASIPRDATALRSFLGLARYFSKYIRVFSDVVELLRSVLREEGVFTWTIMKPI